MTAETLRSEFASAREDAAALLEGHGDAQVNWRRAPGTWSMAQCLDHLNLTGRKYLRALDRAIDEGRAKNLVGKGPFRYGLLECWTVRAMDAPPMFRIKAPKAFAPAAESRLAESRDAFLALQGEFQERLTRADGLDLGKVKARSPVSRHIKFSLGKAFAAIAAETPSASAAPSAPPAPVTEGPSEEDAPDGN